MPLDLNRNKLYKTSIGPTGEVVRSIVIDGILCHLDAGNKNSYGESGTTWTDLSGYGNIGTLINGPTYNSNNSGVITFDGTNDYVTISSLSSQPTTQITCESWIKPTRTVSTGTVRGGVISATNTMYLGIFNSADGGSTHSLHWANTTDSSRPSSADGNIPNNIWSHIVGTWDGSTSRAYVNGNQVWSAAQSGTINSATYVVGTYGSGLVDGVHNFQGQISIARIYNISLSAIQVSHNYNVQKSRFGL